MADIILQLNQIKKNFGEGDVLHGITLSVYKGEFLTLLGPSGCGKTTTLRIIAGLDLPSEGSVLLNNIDVTNTPPEKRNVNTVFQSYALFPHMNVYKNIAYGLKLKGMNSSLIKEKVRSVLEMVQLVGFEKRMPSQLSGGQRQRVAIARAIVLEPSILLLDEPLGALDLQLRRQMQTELKRLQQMLGMTFIYITHDQEEALNMSDRIAVMNDGQIEQLDTPEMIYEHPQTIFAAGFIGQTNLIDCTVAQNGLVQIGDAYVPAQTDNFSNGEKAVLSLRMERVHYRKTIHDGDLVGVVKERHFAGGTKRTVITLPTGQDIIAISQTEDSDHAAIGAKVSIHFAKDLAALVRGETHA